MHKEPPLHRAVIDNDLEKVRFHLSENETTNHLGFTALEMAYYLDRKEAVAILSDKKYPKSKWDINYIPTLKFADYDAFKAVIRECPYRLRFLEEIPFEIGVVADVKVQWIDDVMGNGLFANANLKEGTCIGEYTGLVRRYYRRHPDQNGYCFRYPTRFWSLRYYMVDALTNGNELRFINHNNQPNLKPFCFVDRGLLHLCFYTTRDIQKNEELTFDYGPDYWRRREKA